MDRLQEIEERIDKATPGKWKLGWYHAESAPVVSDNVDEYGDDIPIMESCGCCGGVDMYEDDAKFISHSKEDIRYLLGEVKKLQATQEK